MLVISILGITKALILPVAGLLLLTIPPFKTVEKKGLRSLSAAGWALFTFSVLICISGIRDLRAQPVKEEVVLDMSPHVQLVNSSSYIYVHKKDTLFYKFLFANPGRGDAANLQVAITAVGIFNNPKHYQPIPERSVNLYGLMAGESKEIKQSIVLDGNKAPDSIYFQLKSVYPTKNIDYLLRWYPGVDSIQTVAAENMVHLLPYLQN
jgi:hypothetical protein